MFSDWLAGELRKRGWSHSELARRAGLSQVSVSGVIAGTRVPGCDFCVKVAMALEVSPVSVMIEAGILPPQATDDDPVIAEIIESTRLLPPDQRRDVLDYIRFKLRKKREE